MTKRPPPATPVDAYKAIIDELVKQTSESVHASLIEEARCRPKERNPFAHQAINAAPSEMRRAIADFVREERSAAIHDVLAVLSWWIECGGVALMFKGKPMPVELSGQGIRGDYVGRMHDWEWPDLDED